MAKRFKYRQPYRRNTGHSGSHYVRPPSTGFQEGGETKPTSSFDKEWAASNSHAATKFEEVEARDLLDDHMGFTRYSSSAKRQGWLINARSTLIRDPDWPGGRSAVDFYFIQEDGEYFKATLTASPYFYIRAKNDRDAEEFLRRKFEHLIEQIEHVPKEDLDQPNHLVGLRRNYLRLAFRNVGDLVTVKKYILAAVRKNQASWSEHSSPDDALYHDVAALQIAYDHVAPRSSGKNKDLLGAENIIDARECDIPYHLRVCIDGDIRVGLWYEVSSHGTTTTLIQRLTDQPARPDPVILAFDIETTKLPLKFPDPAMDSIMMISYMIDGRGHLIVNREIVSEDIQDFEYSPTNEYEGQFKVYNAPGERELLQRFFSHVQTVRPTVFVTYNGDFFDWPFVEARATVHGMSMQQMIGMKRNVNDEFEASYAIHMDAFKWVKRDSYLPVGSQGLKAVTAIKLGYQPLEIDPEDMVRYAQSSPQTLASYSVSDAVCTYYLYLKYVHPFVFSLCNIIPLSPDEVLRKGSGTLCETLLMAEAFRANIIMPNKHVQETGATFNGHLLESETYVGGHVEALESGVFRADIPVKFSLDPEMLQSLIADLDATLQFAVEVEHRLSIDEVADYDDVKARIQTQLETLLQRPNIVERPLIYHLDVAAMYPNIILTNRLQPPSIITEASCAVCDHNVPGKTCQRKMHWSWRGEYFLAKRNEFKMIQNQLESESFPSSLNDRKPKGIAKAATVWTPYTELPASEQQAKLKQRLTQYCRKIYKKIHETKIVQRESIVCMKENSFYVDTVRLFRDRRYEFKNLLRDAKKALDLAIKKGVGQSEIEACRKACTLYDSLQLAHKCILNSFYGYVMRKGSRWYSMEMAGIVCQTGANIITLARRLVEKIGRPLELDTDGIWCILPSVFPDKFNFTLRNGTKTNVSYPCLILNKAIHADFTNYQYATLVDRERMRYETSAQNSIFFEIDGPYKAMIIPASVEEDRLIKKRYAVYGLDGTLAEIKGFEVKRRGELKLTKIFQSQIFDAFLGGTCLTSCYQAVANVANRWLDILLTKGEGLEDFEIFELLSEARNMSKGIDEYGELKSTAINTARRLGEFLGEAAISGGGGNSSLNCQFIISEKPMGAPIAARSIPVAIFNAESDVRTHYLRRWLKDPSLPGQASIKDILDWGYYKERFESVLQKLIIIPAAMQGQTNPLPRVNIPEWLWKRQRDRNFVLHGQGKQQLKLTTMRLASSTPKAATSMTDIEDQGLFPAAQGQLKKEAEGEKMETEEGEGEGEVELEVKTKVNDKQQQPSMYINYRDWLILQKKKWKRMRDQNRARCRTLQQHWRSGSVDALSTQYWQVLGVFPQPSLIGTTLPGEYRIFALVGGRMRLFKLVLPRTFYVLARHSLHELALPLKKASHWNLPLTKDSAVLQHLYEIELAESVYQSYAFPLADELRASPSIEWLYELDTSERLRLFAAFGSVVMPNLKTMRIDLNKGSFENPWVTTELKIRQDLRIKYLVGVESPGTLPDNVKLELVYFFVSAPPDINGTTTTIGGKAKPWLILCVIPSMNWCKVWCYDTTAQASVHFIRDQIGLLSSTVATVPNEHKPQWMRKLTAVSGKASLLDCQMEHQEKNEKKLWKSMRETLGHLRIFEMERGQRAPLLLLLQSTQSLFGERAFKALLENVPILSEYPRLILPSVDSKETWDFNMLAHWQRHTIKIALAYIQTDKCNEYLSDLMSFSRYLNIPLCNLTTSLNDDDQDVYGNNSKDLTEEERWLAAMLDVAYARLLKNNHILLPSRTIETCFETMTVMKAFVDFHAPYANRAATFAFEDQAPDHEETTTSVNSILNEYAEWINKDSKNWINVPGYYRHVCVELELVGLTANAILECSNLDLWEDTFTHGHVHAEAGPYVDPNAYDVEKLLLSKSSSSSLPFGTENSDNGILQRLERVLEWSNLAETNRNGWDDYQHSLLFTQLKLLVGGLGKDIATYKSPQLDKLLGYLDRWLTHSSRVVPNQLVIKVTQLKMKVLLKLVKELNMLGAQVVYIDPDGTRLVLMTRKDTTWNALAYVEYLKNEMMTKTGLVWLSLIPVTVYQDLLWINEHNFMALKTSAEAVASCAMEDSSPYMEPVRNDIIKENPFLSSSRNEEQPLHHQVHGNNESLSQGPKSTQFIQNWSILESFPGELQSDLHNILNEFMQLLQKHQANYKRWNRKQCKDVDLTRPSSDTFLSSELPHPLTSDPDMMDHLLKVEEDDDQENLDLLKDSPALAVHNERKKRIGVALPQGFMMKLYDWFSHVIKNPLSNERSYIPLKVLQFVVLVLGADERLADQVMKIRKQLLLLLRLPEFSTPFTLDETRFTPEEIDKEPLNGFALAYYYRNLVLFNVPCTSCLTLQSLHLAHPSSMTTSFQCKQCHTKLDHSMLQELALNKCTQMLFYFTSQDIQCHHCQSVSEFFMRNGCQSCKASRLKWSGMPKHCIKLCLKEWIQLAARLNWDVLSEYLTTVYDI